MPTNFKSKVFQGHSPIFSQVLWPPNPLVSTDTSYLAGVNPVQDGKKRFNMKDWLGGQVVPRRPTFEWLPFHYKGEDGWYLTTRGDNIVLQHVDTRKSENPVVLASLSDLRIVCTLSFMIQSYRYIVSAWYIIARFSNKNTSVPIFFIS